MKSTKIKNDDDYNAEIGKITKLMAKGSENVSKEELEEIRKSAIALQAYEQQKYDIIPPEIN